MSTVESVEAKKKFGQNFLVNPSMQSRIIQELEKNLSGVSRIVEIGPGRGDLTQHIINFGCEVLALEIDPDAVVYVSDKFKDSAIFSVSEVDALELIENDKNLESVFSADSVLFSNLPFNVGSRILVSLGVEKSNIPFVVILQKEVVDKCDTRNKITFLGAWINLIWDTKNVFQISRGNFSPAPKVMSALMTGKPRVNEWLEGKNIRLECKNILKSLFAQPKKTVSNNLRNMNWSVEKVDRFLTNFGYENNLRLNWSNYEEVLQNILKFESEDGK